MCINIGYASEIYEIDPRDITVLPDCAPELSARIKHPEPVTVLLGNRDQNRPDALVCGREQAERALNDEISYIPVRFCFVSNIPAWNLIPLFIKKFRYKYKYFNTNIYHLSAKKLRQQGLERGIRTAENAYAITNKRWAIPEEERRKKYQNLVDSMKNGFDDNYPLSIMLCRRAGLKDSLDNGHHRMGICLDLGIDRICVNFIAAGKAPDILTSIYKILKK